jgi:hypothetical protein
MQQTRKQTKEDNYYKPPPPFLRSIGNTMRNRKLKAPPQKQKKEKKAPKRGQDKRKKKPRSHTGLRTQRRRRCTLGINTRFLPPPLHARRTKRAAQGEGLALTPIQVPPPCMWIVFFWIRFSGVWMKAFCVRLSSGLSICAYLSTLKILLPECFSFFQN